LPQVDDPQWRQYLSVLAASADARRIELGRGVAADPPQWAVETFGAPPSDASDADVWHERAGAVAAHRELTGHDDLATALGPPPKPGQVEAYASWRAAWRALGRPEADRDELEMSNGQLRMRIRAAQREEAWAPRWVANELAGTEQAAAAHRQTATLRAAEAAATDDAEQRARLQREAVEAAALADVLDARVTELVVVDDARAHWLMHTAHTRAAADRATAELSARHAADGLVEEPAVSAAEWLAEHTAATRAEDAHRVITDEAELVDVAEQRATDRDTLDDGSPRGVAETDIDDLRQVAAAEPKPPEDDTVRVPSADETAHSIARAQRALTEIEHRRTLDQARAADEARSQQLARWHADAQDTHQQVADRDGPALETV
jgi:hypothetical protein